MHLTDLLSMWGIEQVRLITTATNGLNSMKDRMLGFAGRILTDGDECTEVYLNYTTGIELQAASKFHGISETDMQSQGLSETQFRDKLYDFIVRKNALVFTYNVPFQTSFISNVLDDLDNIPLYDLTVIEKTLRLAHAFDEEELLTPASFYGACCAYSNPVPVGALCKYLLMTKDPVPGQLPMERMLDVLHRLYSTACSPEVLVLQS